MPKPKTPAAPLPTLPLPNIQRLFDAVNDCNNSIRRVNFRNMKEAQEQEAAAHAKLRADLKVLGIEDLFDYSRE